MAEEVMLEGNDKEKSKQDQNGEIKSFEEVVEKKWFEDLKFLFILALMIGIFIILLLLSIFLYSKNSAPSDAIVPQTTITPQNVQIQDESLKFDSSRINAMIQKANALYLKGQRDEALDVYEQISVYSEALSNYNLGVSQMEQKNYDLALESFKKAIANNENETVSAINAAVAALHLKQPKLFEYYLDLAYVYLSNEGNSELFNYYLSLINYYKGFYPEALQMFQKTQNENYTDEAKYLSAKIYAKMGLDSKAIENLEAQGLYRADLPLGLLYARVGDYDNARKALEQSLKVQKDFNRSLATLSLIDLKTGRYQDMFNRLSSFAKGNEQNILAMNKIKVYLKKELTNINIAQQNFTKDFLTDKKSQADILFYFAPYQVFNANQATDYINKANASHFLADKSDNETYLENSKAISSANVRLAKIISKAFDYELIVANDEFKKLLSAYPEHSVLHYNLALSYAQLQNYELAYKHFSTSYHLDPKNYAAGAFAMLTGSLNDKEIVKLSNEITDNISADNNFKQEIYRSIMLFANNENNAMISFLDNDTQKLPLNLILRIIIAKNNRLSNEMDKNIIDLKNTLNDDIMANILYFNSRNSNLNIKDYAKNAQIYFKELKIDYKDLSGGAKTLRDNYVSLMRVIGLLNQERENIKAKLAVEISDHAGLIALLAYMDIYAGLYEEAYALYSTLIDDYKIKDSMTLFLASVAAIGANNPNAAIALLELSKLEDGGNEETRLALGLLYQEVQNYEPALFQYKTIKNDFKSKFFTFNIREDN